MEKNEQASAHALQLSFVPIRIHLTAFGKQPRTAAGAELAPTLETGRKVTLLLPPKKIIILRMNQT